MSEEQKPYMTDNKRHWNSGPKDYFVVFEMEAKDGVKTVFNEIISTHPLKWIFFHKEVMENQEELFPRRNLLWYQEIDLQDDELKELDVPKFNELTED